VRSCSATGSAVYLWRASSIPENAPSSNAPIVNNHLHFNLLLEGGRIEEFLVVATRLRIFMSQIADKLIQAAPHVKKWN